MLFGSYLEASHVCLESHAWAAYSGLQSSKPPGWSAYGRSLPSRAFLYRSLAVLVCCCWACSIKKYIQMCHHPRRTCTMHQASLIEIEEYRVLPEGEY